MQADLELVRRASSASCESEITDLEWQTALNDITDLEWQTALNDGSFRSAKESLSPAANPRLPFRLQRAERNPGSPEDAQQQHDSVSIEPFILCHAWPGTEVRDAFASRHWHGLL